MDIEPTESSASGKKGWVRPEERLARLGFTQHRQVTIEQIRAAGWDNPVISARVDHGRLHPVFRGVYSLGGPPQTQREWWMAATLTYGPGTRLSDSAAAELYGWVRYPLNELHVTTPTERSPRQNITPHCRSSSTHWRIIDNIPVTSPEQTILDCAATLTNDKIFRRIIRLAQAAKTTTHAKLLLISSQSAGVRGVARLRRELETGPAPTRRANEDEVRALLKHPGKSSPTP